MTERLSSERIIKLQVISGHIAVSCYQKLFPSSSTSMSMVDNNGVLRAERDSVQGGST
jgi:hypothetical protein